MAAADHAFPIRNKVKRYQDIQIPHILLRRWRRVIDRDDYAASRKPRRSRTQQTEREQQEQQQRERGVRLGGNLLPLLKASRSPRQHFTLSRANGTHMAGPFLSSFFAICDHLGLLVFEWI